VTFTLLDWSAIAGYFAVTLVMGLWFRRRSSRSIDDYFVSGRKVNWWLAGTSMVATTFAADTPLVVTGLVYSQGISGNWLWWCLLPSGMLTVFLFARLWRRSGLLTDVQFAEIRYSGKPAAFLRGFRALYLGLLMNCVILGWVTKAMTSIVATTFAGTPMLRSVSGFMSAHFGSVWSGNDGGALAICVFFLIPFTGLYVALGGLWGVLWTDLFQFVLKMSIVIAVGYYAVEACGGTTAMIRSLQQMQRSAGVDAASPLGFLPQFSRGVTAEPLWMVPVASFLVFIGLQWWAFWYPGAEPGGGGYIAQRIFSARDERQGLLSVLWFNIAHYAIRPWPWIVTGLAVIVLYPGLQHPESGYMMVLNAHLPHQYRGIAIAGFLAAFMSTIATQLNWGASYLVNDFYRRFLKKNGSERHYVLASRICTVLLVVVSAWVSVQLGSIASGWQVVLQIGAGTGAVYILRWYWWRINAWSEISAMTCSLLVTIALHRWQPFAGNASVVFAKDALTTTIVTTAVWLAVTLLTSPEPDGVLISFYERVRPDVRGWQRIAAQTVEPKPHRDIGGNLLAWILGCAMIYLCLFGTGKLLLHEPAIATLMLAGSAICAALLYGSVVRNFAIEPPQRAGTAGAGSPAQEG